MWHDVSHSQAISFTYSIASVDNLLVHRATSPGVTFYTYSERISAHSVPSSIVFFDHLYFPLVRDHPMSTYLRVYALKPRDDTVYLRVLRTVVPLVDDNFALCVAAYPVVRTFYKLSHY